MEVLYRNQHVFGSQSSMMYPPTLMFGSPSDAYASCALESSTGNSRTMSMRPVVSRTPSPVRQINMSQTSDFHSFSGAHGTTLQSVLRGEVPAAYSHLVSSHHTLQPQRHSPLPKRERESPNMEPPSLYVRCPADVLSPPPEDMQTEPMDLSFKRPSSASSDTTSSSTASPTSFHHTFPPSPAEDHQGHQSEFSLLRNLLSVGKQSVSLVSPSLSSGSSDRSCDSPCSDSGATTRHVTGTTRVTLAKKNMYPVSARVSDWLVKVVQFAKSIPEFIALDHNDKVTLILNSWSRLLLLYMAESSFQFAVTPLRSDPEPSDMDGGPSPDEPTMKSVEGVQTFIRKCQNMGVEAKEYAFLRMLVLFNSGYVGLSRPDVIDSLNSVVQQLLQQHVRVSRPDDVMHYSRLLMCLPSLYGVSSKMVEKLFCKHINRKTDMEVLLKELLQNL